VASHKQYLLSQHTRCLIVLSGTTEHKPFANCTFHLKHAMHDALLYLPLHCALFLSKFLITCSKLHLPFAACHAWCAFVPTLALCFVFVKVPHHLHQTAPSICSTSYAFNLNGCFLLLHPLHTLCMMQPPSPLCCWPLSSLPMAWLGGYGWDGNQVEAVVSHHQPTHACQASWHCSPCC